jgi:hypothetical protein
MDFTATLGPRTALLLRAVFVEGQLFPKSERLYGNHHGFGPINKSKSTEALSSGDFAQPT